MTKSIGYVAVCCCLLGLGACSIERYDDDCDSELEYSDDDAGHGARTGRAGSPGTGTGGNASSAGTGGSSASGAASSTGGGGTSPAPTACEEERDCERGFNCDLEAQQCVASDAETCAELESEAACSNRRDCVPIYGGINCSCGQDCECKGGEPGCICESFDFFACQAAPE